MRPSVRIPLRREGSFRNLRSGWKGHGRAPQRRETEGEVLYLLQRAPVLEGQLLQLLAPAERELSDGPDGPRHPNRSDPGAPEASVPEHLQTVGQRYRRQVSAVLKGACPDLSDTPGNGDRLETGAAEALLFHRL